MSNVYPANFIPNRVVISRLRLFVEKNSFDSTWLCFSCVTNKDAGRKGGFSEYFTFLLSERIKNAVRARKKFTPSLWRRCINGS